MEIEITNKVQSHHTNPDYVCVLVKFNDGKNNFRLAGLDWLPTDEEGMELFRAMYNYSPTFRRKVCDEFKLNKEVNKNGERKISDY